MPAIRGVSLFPAVQMLYSRSTYVSGPEAETTSLIYRTSQLVFALVVYSTTTLIWWGVRTGVLVLREDAMITMLGMVLVCEWRCFFRTLSLCT